MQKNKKQIAARHGVVSKLLIFKSLTKQAADLNDFIASAEDTLKNIYGRRKTGGKSGN